MSDTQSKILFFCLNRCDGMDLVTDRNRFAKVCQSPFWKDRPLLGLENLVNDSLYSPNPLWIHHWILERIELVRVQMTKFCQPLRWIWWSFFDREKNFGIFRNTNDKKISRRRSIILDEVSWERGGGIFPQSFNRLLHFWMQIIFLLTTIFVLSSQGRAGRGEQIAWKIFYKANKFRFST